MVFHFLWLIFIKDKELNCYITRQSRKKLIYGKLLTLGEMMRLCKQYCSRCATLTSRTAKMCLMTQGEGKC